jgi:RimJ/RimL family protein N-acetyltransferase
MANLPLDIQPTLQGELLLLRPLRAKDFEELYLAASDPLIWEIHPQPTRYQRPVFQKYFESGMASGGALAVIERTSGKIVGSSRFYDLQTDKLSLIIGYTFLTRACWGGKFNTELKALMLSHAFQWASDVYFEVGENNLRSRRAVEKLGAKFVELKTLDTNTHAIYRVSRAEWV